MAHYPGVPWNLRPDYLALTQRVDPAGIVTTYNPPRPGVSATDVTSFVYGQATITRDNWPEIMYYLHPTPEWAAFRGTAQPQQKVDANGQPMVERFPQQGQPPRPLLDFRILPDTICSQEELWWIELWRRMDPRMHWADILMRIEVPNRTEDSDKKLQNSTNNLINRQEHRRYFMLAWHTTGINSTMRVNEVRSMVTRRVAAAHPPLPPNSTRGLTPGLINPLLGNVPGNSVPQPALGLNQGRLRVGGRTQVTQAAAANQALTNAAQANLPQLNQIQGHPVQNNLARNNHGRDKRIHKKRRRTSPVQKGRPPKRQAQNLNKDTEDDSMDTESDQSKSSEDIPLSVAKARAQKARTRKVAKPTTAVGKAKDVKKKPDKKKLGTAKMADQQDSTTDPDLSEPNDDEEDNNEEGDSSGGRFLIEGDTGFETAYQASIQARREARASGRAPRRPPRPGRRPSANPPNRRTPHVSVSELLGDTEDCNFVAPALRPDTETAPRASAPPPQPTDAPTPAPHRNISAITGLPFAGQHRRPEALSGYGDGPMRRRTSPVRDSRVAQSTSVRTAEDNDGREAVTPTSNAARLGLPVASADRPPQSFYALGPDGSHHHHTDGSGTATYTTRPGPSSNSRLGFTPNQRAQAQAQAQAQNSAPPPNSGGNAAQPVGPSAPTGRVYDPTDTDTTRQATRSPAGAPTGQRDPTPTHRTGRLTDEIARHNNALIEEIHRRERWPRHELGRHTRAVFEIMRGGEPSYAEGFLEREDERERREREPSSDDE